MSEFPVSGYKTGLSLIKTRQQMIILVYKYSPEWNGLITNFVKQGIITSKYRYKFGFRDSIIRNYSRNL